MHDDTPASTPIPEGLRSEVDGLKHRVAELEVLAGHLAASAALQGLRSGAQAQDARSLDRQLRLMQASTIWRATRPLRLLLDLARGGPPSGSPEIVFLRRLLGIARRRGLRAGAAEMRDFLALRRAALRRRAETSKQAPELQDAPRDDDASIKRPFEVLAPNVLIIAELTLPQCAKYRVWQKQEMFALLGVPCRVVDWRHAWEALGAASLATQVILYRVPGYPVMLRLIGHLHALRVPVSWEVDDLIFDHALYLKNRNVHELDAETHEGVTSGIDLYRSAMLACGHGIASTDCLAEAMRAAGLADVVVVENALDSDTLMLAARLRAERIVVDPQTDDADVVIAYGSGTKTHDADFREAAPALLQLLAAFPRLRLRVVGELTLSAAFDAFAERVERVPPVPFAHYLQLLGESDISIAPLEPTMFNDAKSNIKFLEAAILGLPSVCSPRAQFLSLIEHGTTSYLADGDTAWFDCLKQLIGDADLRRRMGQAALQQALQRYDPEAVARAQIAPLLAGAPDLRPKVDLRVMFANIYYAPRSFGGATLVVQEMAQRLHADAATEVHIFTSLAPDAAHPVMTRTEQAGMAVYALPVPEGDPVAEFDNPSIGAEFGHVLDAVRPDVVHLHAVQWLSASLAAACLERRIPYVITLHDAWWLCARQFMVRADGQYCFQEKIDLHVCQNCNPAARHLEQRAIALKSVLEGAALLLSPSEAHRRLYLANGVAPEKIKVAPNGVRMPKAAPARRERRAKMRFAYVGGDVEVKGFSIVKRAFEGLARADWELLLVDNTQKLGFSSMDAKAWAVSGTISIVPAYTQDGIDAFFDGIDVLLFPSQWKESFGLTVREALMRHVWVIATDGGGPGEAIVDGANGTLIPLDGRPDGLRAAIEYLLDHPQSLENFHNPASVALLDYDAQAAALRETLAQVSARHRASQMRHQVH